MTTDVQSRPISAPAAPAPTRRLDIQGLRAVAVILVVAFHARLPVPGGFVGVDVFFVISGFVITAMLMREWAQRARIRFGHFYLRRFLRLTPALAMLVAIVALASVFLQNPFGAQQTTARTGMGAMLLSANYVIGHAAGDYFADNAVTNPLLNTWSLSVEEQFYLVFPALLLLGWVLARRHRRAPVIVVAVIAAGSFALSIAWSFGSPLASALTSYFGGAESFAFYSSITRAWEFAVGALLALLLTRIPVPSTAVARLLGWTGAAMVALAAFAIHDDQPFPGFAALLPVVGTMLLILAGVHRTVGVSTALSSRPMVFVGDISYSWYLWHWPVIVFAGLLYPNRPWVLVAAAVGSLLPSLGSYWLVEQPLRRYRPRSRVRAGSLVVVTLGIPIALCVGLLAGANAGWGLIPPPPPSEASSVVVGKPGVQTTTPDEASGVRPSADAGAATSAGAAAATPTPAPVDATADGDGEVVGGEGGSLRAAHVAVQAGCVNTDLDPAGCRFGPTDARGTVLLAGDSQAYALADGVIAAGEQLGLDTVVTSHTGCPFLARESSGVHNYPCGAWQDSIVQWALDAKPSVVVIANRAGGYVRPGKQWRTVARDDGGAATSVEEAADLYRRGLEPVVQKFTKAGIPVIVMASVPEMTGYTDRTSLLGRAFGSQAFEIPRADAEADRAPALEVEKQLAATYPGMRVYDPITALCTDICSTERDGQPVYQDETHLSVPGSLLLADTLRAEISPLAPETPPQRR